MTRHRTGGLAAFLVAWALSAPPVAGQELPASAANPSQSANALRQRAERDGQVRVIVELRLPAGAYVPEGRAPDPAAVAAQRRAIADAAARVLERLPQASHRVVHRYQTVPFVALEVNANALDALGSAQDVVRVLEDSILKPVLSTSASIIEADQTWAAGFDGAGTTIAILDSGVDAQHPFLGGKVLEEACYSSTVAGTSRSVCPSGHDQQLGAGAAAPCQLSGCHHGTHVAGIAAGNGASAGQSFSGVAKNAQIMAVQVFSEVIDANTCGGVAPCLGGFASDVIAGLERVYAVAAQRNIAAVNMSLGTGAFSGPCDSEPYKPIIDNLRSIGVATIVASGNSGYFSSISAPACVSSAVSVGSTERNDQISWFSNVASFLSLLAPGGAIVSSVPGGGFASLSGTSMAAPHVAGAWALARQAAPGASVTSMLSAFRQTGVPVTDTRFFGSVTVPRARTLRALASLVPVTNPAPAITSVTPARVRAGSGATTVTITGTGFNTFSVVRWNGQPRATSVVNTSQITGTITAQDLASAGTGQVSVWAPSPGGGSSTPLTVVIDPPPTLSVNAGTVGPGSPVTVTLSNGLGNSADWLALAASGAANNSYLAWTYVGSGITSRTWTVTMPSTAGTYEFRLFLNGGYTRAATSPPVTVDPALNPIPSVTSLSPASTVMGGPSFILTVVGKNFISGSVVRWNGANRSTTFVNSTQLQASIAASDISAVATAQVTVFTPSPGGGTSPPVSFAIRTPPSLSVSSTTAQTGASVTATLTNGLGGSGDWLALAATGAANNSYITYTYVGAGVVNRTWTATMPSTPGTYEFRLFLNNGYTRAATSPAITVGVGPNPVPVVTSTTPGSALVGSGAFTLTVRGSGFVASSVVRWNGANRTTTFVNSTELRAAIAAADVATAGTAQISVFSPEPGGGLSSPLPFTIGSSNAAISVSATSVAGGSSVTATLTNGLGGTSDWLALAATSSPNSSYVQYIYVGAGVTTKVWTVAMPLSPGTYEFRLFTNGYVRVATSPTITVTSSVQPQLAVSATSVTAGASVTVTLTNGYGGSGDWLALASTSAPNTSYIRYVYVGAGKTSTTWTVAMPTTPGTYEFRLFLNNGYTRAATSPAVTVK